MAYMIASTKFLLLVFISSLLFAQTHPHGMDTDIHLAVKEHDLSKVKMLVQKDKSLVNLKHPTMDGMTPLHYSAWFGFDDITLFLLDNGADINALTDDSRDTPIGFAVCFNKYRTTKLLVDKGANLNLKNKYESSLLHDAACSSDVRITKLLLEKGLDVNAKCHFEKDDGWTPLHQAVHFENTGVIKLLLANGANINSRTKLGWTPLKWAIHKKYKKMVKLLKDYGAKE